MAIDGDLTVNINGNNNGFDMYTGQIFGALSINAKNNIIVQFITADTYSADSNEYVHENSSVTNTAGNITFLTRRLASTGDVTDNANTRAAYSSYTNNNLTLTSAGDITLKTGGASRLTIDVGGDAEIGQGTNFVDTNVFTATGNGNVEFVGDGLIGGASYDLFSIDIGGNALIDNYDFNNYPNLYGVSVIAGGDIEAEGFTHFYGNAQGINTDNAQPYTFEAGGDIDLSNLVAIGIPEDVTDINTNDTDPRAANVSITSTSGNIDVSLLTSILTTDDGTTTIDAGTGNVDAQLLATHEGSSLTVGGALIMVEALESSTGDLTLNGDLVQADGTADEASPVLATWNTLTVGSDTRVELPLHDDENAGAMTLTLAEIVSTNSITISEVSAPAMTSLELTAQSTSFALVDGDFDSAAAGYVIDITGDSTLDAMSFTGVSNLTGLTTDGNVDTFVVDGNPLLETITADHENVVGADANPLGTKLHLIDNVALTAYTSNTSKMQEIIITGNTALADLDLTSYLDDDGDATDDDTAFDGFTVDFILNVTNNGLTGLYTPKDNSGTPDTSLQSDDLVLSGVRAIALHLLAFDEGNTDVVADFVGLTTADNAVNQYSEVTNFTDGITTIPEFEILVEEAD